MDNGRENSEKQLSSPEEGIVTAYRTSVDGWMKANSELEMHLKPTNETVGSTFLDYLKSMSSHLPQAVLISETESGKSNVQLEGSTRYTIGYKRYFLPAEGKIYSVHNPPIMEDLSPESPNFRGFDNVDKENLDSGNSSWIEKSNSFLGVLGNAVNLQTPEITEDPNVSKANEEFERAKKSYKETEKTKKVELGRELRRRINNLKTNIIAYRGKNSIPQRIISDEPSEDGKFLSFLPREDKMVKVGTKKNIFKKNVFDFDNAEDTSDDAYYDLHPARPLLTKSGLGYLERYTMGRQ